MKKRGKRVSYRRIGGSSESTKVEVRRKIGRRPRLQLIVCNDNTFISHPYKQLPGKMQMQSCSKITASPLYTNFTKIAYSVAFTPGIFKWRTMGQIWPAKGPAKIPKL